MNEEYLAFITHDTKFNTLEATWLINDGVKLTPTRRRNYSADQKDAFLADVGSVGQKYTDMAGW